MNYLYKKKKHIFDKIMEFSLLYIFEPFYKTHKELILYLFFGGISFLINIFLFIGIDEVFEFNELVNNAICWIVCVLLQFFTNRIWVFNGHVDSIEKFYLQIVSFVGGRLFTLLIEEMILGMCIVVLGLEAILIKLAAQIIVIILNYIISKLIVFKKT